MFDESNVYFKYMKKVYVSILFVLILGISVFLIIRFNAFLLGEKNEVKGPVINLTCNNGYAMSIQYAQPDKTGVMTQMSLNVLKDGTTHIYDLRQALSGSGSKFETADQKYSLWEHQGEFTFAIGDVTEAICTASS